MTYYPLPTPPPFERRHNTSQQVEQQTFHSEDQDIRSVPTPTPSSYDYTYSGGPEEDEYEEYRGTERPPSFQSTNINDQQTQQGVFLGLAEDDSYASLPPQRRYEARSQVDLDLRLQDEPVPRYPRSQLGNEVYRDLEDVKRAGEFEDSFEGDGEISYVDDRALRNRGTRVRQESDIVDDDEEADPNSPTISFKGGFGAPPTVRSSLSHAGLTLLRRKLIFFFRSFSFEQSAHLRRNMTNRRVKLTEGNLVIECHTI